MTITQLTLTNFRAAQGLRLDLHAPRVLISGRNGAGKSSIREAIRWALRGIADVTDLKGAGAEALAPHGTEQVAVSLDLAGIGTVTREYSERTGTVFTVEGFTGSTLIQQAALYQKLGTTPAYLDAVLATEQFARLHHADAKALVLALLDVKVTVHDVTYGLDELDRAHAKAYEQRKDAKRRLQLTPPPVMPVLPESVSAAMGRINVTTVEPLLAAIEDRLTTLRQEHGALRQQVGETIGRRQALRAERNRLAGTREAATPVVPDTMRARLAELDGLLAQPVVDSSPIHSPLQMFRSRLAALQAHDPKQGCVLDAEVPCKTPKVAFQRQVEALEATVAVPTTEPPTSPRDALERERQKIQQHIRDADVAEQRQVEAGGRLAEVEEDLSSLPETADQENTLATFNAQIAKGEGLLREVQTYQTAKAVAENSATTRQALDADVDRLEKEVEQFGPKGLRVVALADAMGRFEQTINGYLTAWGWTVSFVVEPWTVLVNGRNWDTYSRSERHRIGIGIQFAIAQMSGLSFALIDEADMLDAENRRLLASMVADAPLAQVLMCATREDSVPLPASMDGWIFVRLQGSQLAEVVRSGVAA